MDKTDQLMTVAETAAYLAMTTKGVRGLIADGRLPAYHLGSRVIRLRRSEVDAALAPVRA